MGTIPYSELKKGGQIIFNNQPYEIIEASSMFKARGHSVLQAKLKNLITGNIISETFHPSDTFEEAELSKIKAKFLYSHTIRKSSISNGASRERFFFSEKDNPSKRFDLIKEQIGGISKFLKPNQIVEAIIFKPSHQRFGSGGKDKIVNISLPIKIQLKVAQAPPGIKGDRAQAGNKIVVLETGAEINVPLFIEEGDIIEINTEKGSYIRRLDKR